MAFKFIILTWLTSFITAVYCQMGTSGSDIICNVTIFHENCAFPGAVANEWQSKMIDSCPENYTNQDTIASCERFYTKKDFDLDLFIPKTNNITKITYMNKYCGYCNNENDTNLKWSHWSFWDKFRYSENLCSNYASKIEASEVDDLDKWVQTFISDGMILETTSYRRKLQCSGKSYWPMGLISYVIPCIVRHYKRSQYRRTISYQYYEKNGRSCHKMEFIIDAHSHSYGSEFYLHLSKIDLTLGDYIVLTGNDYMVFRCAQFYDVAYSGKLVRIGISIAFLCAYLFMNFNKRYFDIFLNQLLYVYSIGLIVMSVLLTYMYLKFPVSHVSFYVVKIFWTYHFLWTTLILIVFCNIAFCLCVRCESITKGNTNACYSSVLFVFGLVLPLSLPIMYLYFLETYEYPNQSSSIPGHTSVPKVPSGNLLFLKFVLEASLTFLTPIILVVGIICIMSDLPYSSDEVRPETSRRNSPIVLFKMLLIMGIHWVLYTLCSRYYGNEKSYTIFGQSINMDMMAQFSFDIHGGLIFFVFLTENTMINDILVKHGYKRGNTTRENSNGATEITVQLES